MNAKISTYWLTLKDAWNNRANLGDKNLTKVERAFLPAALEILDTPPSPSARILTISLITLFSIAVIWACLGHIDIIATAQGKIIPSGRVKQIQPLEKAVVKLIYIKEGQFVNQGDPLIELDQALTTADQTKLSQELAFIESNITRQNLFVKLLANPSQALDITRLHTLLPVNTQPGSSDQTQLLMQQWNSYSSKRQSLSAQFNEKDAERRSSMEIIKQLQETLPIATKQYQAYKTLREKDMISDFDQMEKEKAYIEQRQTLAAERARQEQLAASVRTIEKEIQALEAETRRQALSDIQDNERQRQSITQELNKAKDLNAKQVLHAPVSGTVQQLVVTTIGGVVTEAQPLMLIVPRGEKLEAEVDVENKDIGFVRVGQKAEIKIDTFPYTRYGIIDAQITGITKDAVENKDAASGQNKTLVYKMRLTMAKSSLWVDGKDVELGPGMTVTAEVKTGKRRLIEYFLSPLIQHVGESVRER